MLDRPAVAAGPAAVAGGAAPAAHAIRHRPEIDGLRSFAILPILLLHCGVSGLRGGFVGVDIFFVISGYLITAIILRELDAGTFSLAAFYRRRVVRILPALLAMVAIVLVVGSMLLLPGPLRDLGHSAAAVAAFGSNIYFYATTDYFAQASEMKPLVHTWSLAVEEQFYLIYPVFLLATRRMARHRLARAMAMLALASFVAGGVLAAVWPVAGFYLLPARIWELLLGGLVAVGAAPAIASRRLRDLLCWAALAGIVFCCVVTGSGWPFPVPFALPPAIGAAILLAYAPDTSAARFLGLWPLRAVGLVSYSLYLWHRPIIAFYLLGRSTTMTAVDTVILIAASFVAAIASYLLIERPALRRWRSGTGGGPLLAALAALAVCGAAGLAVAANAERLRPLPPDVARVASYLGFEASPRGKAQFGTDRCFVIPTGHPFDPVCLTLAPGRANVLLVGDSHAAQLSESLRRQLAPVNLMQGTAAGCRPLLEGRGMQRCRAVVRQALRETDLSRVSAVILAGRWFAEDIGPLSDTVRYLRDRGVAVVVVGPVVEYDAEVPDILARAMLAGDPAGIARFRREDRAVLDRAMAPPLRAAGAAYVSQFPLECPQGRCMLFMGDGVPLHMDQSHLTPPAADMVARAVVAQLPAALHP